MIEHDFLLFDRAFKRLASIFQLRMTGVALDELSRSYFKVLSGAPVQEVLDAGTQAVQTRRTFPKPADWLALLRPVTRPSEAPVSDADRWTFHECPSEPCDRTFAHLPHSYVRRRLSSMTHPSREPGQEG